jgi:hypothetical protein
VRELLIILTGMRAMCAGKYGVPDETENSAMSAFQLPFPNHELVVEVSRTTRR